MFSKSVYQIGAAINRNQRRSAKKEICPQWATPGTARRHGVKYAPDGIRHYRGDLPEGEFCETCKPRGEK